MITIPLPPKNYRLVKFGMDYADGEMEYRYEKLRERR
jgi:hypothetical protein